MKKTKFALALMACALSPISIAQTKTTVDDFTNTQSYNKKPIYIYMPMI